jgi:hypothetical protein
MMNPKVLEILKQAIALSVEDQRELNSALVDNIKRVHKIKAISNSAKYNIGDTVMFRHNREGLIKIQITGFSRDGSKIKGPQIGGFRAGCMWTVDSGTSSLQKV